MNVVQLYLETLGLFVACLIVQIILWRALRRPDDTVPFQIIILFALFLGGPVIYSLIYPSLDRLVIGLGLGSCYIMSFPAAAAKSPTIVILHVLRKTGGLTRPQLETELAKQLDLKGDRLRDLKADGLYTDQGRPSLSGRTLGWMFWTYRRILGIPLGEG
jgi:cellulose synthase/poly-beta-1,6-N-acetylglucosamine synthase-like glycosyltransferase